MLKYPLIFVLVSFRNNVQGTQKRVRMSFGKGAVSVRVIDVKLCVGFPINTILLYSVLYLPHSSFFSHLRSAEITVCARPLPISFHRFGVKGHSNTIFFRDPVKNISAHPYVIPTFYSLARTNTELPLSTRKKNFT